MKKAKNKQYGVRVTIKIPGYRAKSLNGVFVAPSPKIAKEAVVERLVAGYENTKFDVVPAMITVRKIELIDDFGYIYEPKAESKTND